MASVRLASVIVIGFLALLVIQPVRADSSPTAYPLQYPVTFDGRFTNDNEWKDVITWPIDVGLVSNGAYFAAKYDASYLYTMWDFVECTSAFSGNDTYSANEVFMYINPTSKGTETVDPTMWSVLVYSGASASAWARHGTNDGDWTEWDHVSGVDARYQYTTSPHSALTHFIVETRLALSFADLKSAVQSGGMGFVFYFYDGRTDRGGGYPRSWRYKDPSTWGTLDFSQVVVPEFPVLVLPLTASLLLIFCFVKPRHGRKKYHT